MKCRQFDASGVALLIVSIVWVRGDEEYNDFKRKGPISVAKSHIENLIQQNTYESFDSFPPEDFSQEISHKIVKKQMDRTGDDFFEDAKTSAETELWKNNGRDNSDASTAPRRGKRSEFESLNRRFRSNIKMVNLPSAPFSEPKSMVENIEYDLPQQDSGRNSKLTCRIPDKSNCHYYFECEIEPNGCIKMVRKKCPGDETFSMKYRECVHLSFRKGVSREKRHLTSSFAKNKCPEPPVPEGDLEPANEWLDATQGAVQKVPSEFQPRPKLRLRIYHLRCKKTAKKSLAQHGRRQKRSEQFKFLKEEPQKRLVSHSKVFTRKHYVHHHHPRSYVIRLNKKVKEDEESLNEDNEAEDEEEDEEDDEEDDENGDNGKDNSDWLNDDEQLNRKEGFKDLFKSSKKEMTTEINAYKSSPLSQLQPQKCDDRAISSAKKSESSLRRGEGKSNNKVLIDANIKVDEEISSALKNILGKGMKNVPVKFCNPS